MNYHETFEKADINTSTSGDNTLIAAPGAGKYIAIDFISFNANGGVTVQMKDGATAYGGPVALNAGGSMNFENSMHNEHGVITLSDNAAFVLNLGGAVQVSGFIRYRIINK